LSHIGETATGPLDEQQMSAFWQHGYVMLENALGPESLQLLQQDLNQWVNESRDHQSAYGQQLDKRPRFSLEPGHSSNSPALRRIASPVEISEHYLHTMRHGPAVEAITQLIGPNVKYSNSKINLKHPGAATVVKYHQDFCFELHTNDSLITVLYFLDDIDSENGPLEVVPGSHLGPLHDHWHAGVFTGAVSDAVSTQAASEAISCVGRAGTACLMHTRLLHGSAANLSSRARTLYIVSYAAEDAHPVHKNHIPSEFEGEVVTGIATGQVRSSEWSVAMPEYPQDSSFFEQQASSTKVS